MILHYNKLSAHSTPVFFRIFCLILCSIFVFGLILSQTIAFAYTASENSYDNCETDQERKKDEQKDIHVDEGNVFDHGLNEPVWLSGIESAEQMKDTQNISNFSQESLFKENDIEELVTDISIVIQRDDNVLETTNTVSLIQEDSRYDLNEGFEEKKVLTNVDNNTSEIEQNAQVINPENVNQLSSTHDTTKKPDYLDAGVEGIEDKVGLENNSSDGFTNDIKLAGDQSSSEIADEAIPDNKTDDSERHTLTEIKTAALLGVLTSSPVETNATQQILHINATGLSDNADQIVLTIVDVNGIAVEDIFLSRLSDWEQDWIAPSADEYYEIKVKDVLNQSGNSVFLEWDCDISEASSQPLQITETYTDWVERPDLPDGVYAFKFSQNGTEYLLAEGTYKKRPIERYLLSSVAYYGNTSQIASLGVAQWSVFNFASATEIQSMNSHWYLSAQDVSPFQYAVFADEQYQRLLNGVFIYGDPPYYYLKYDNSNCITTDLSLATVFTPLRWETVTLTKTIKNWNLDFSPVSGTEYTAIEVNLQVNGNIADRSLEFSFTSEVNGETLESFSLIHGDSYIIQKIPIGAIVTINENPLGYTAISNVGDNTGEASITFQANGNAPMSVNFVNMLEGSINTGFSAPDDSNYTGTVFAVILIFMGLSIGIAKKIY